MHHWILSELQILIWTGRVLFALFAAVNGAVDVAVWKTLQFTCKEKGKWGGREKMKLNWIIIIQWKAKREKSIQVENSAAATATAGKRDRENYHVNRANWPELELQNMANMFVHLCTREKKFSPSDDDESLIMTHTHTFSQTMPTHTNKTKEYSLSISRLFLLGHRAQAAK